MNLFDTVSSKKKKNFLIWFTASFLLITMLIICCVCILGQKKSYIEQLQANKHMINNHIAELESHINFNKKFVEEKKSAQKQRAKVESYRSPESKKFLNTSIADIASLVPADIYLSELNFHKQITLQGYAVNVKSILDLLRNLTHLPYICNGKIVKLKTDMHQKDLLEFLIRLEVKPCKEPNNGKN